MNRPTQKTSGLYFQTMNITLKYQLNQKIVCKEEYGEKFSFAYIHIQLNSSLGPPDLKDF